MIEELKIIIKAEIDNLKNSLKNAEDDVKSFSDRVKDASKTVDEDIKGLGEGISSGLKTVGTAVAAAGAALLALGASTQEYQAEQAKLTSAFETAGASAEVAKETYNGLYRVLGDSGVATEAAGHLAKLTTNQQSLSEWTTICEGVYATFGDSLPIESLTEAANETAKTGTLTGGLADALNWAGVSEEEFQAKLAACNSEAEREQLIRETLTGLYSGAAAAYEENAAGILAQNEAQSKLNDAMAELGKAIQPILTALTQLGAEVLTMLTPYVQDFAENILPTLMEVLSGLLDIIGNVLAFMKEHPVLLTAIATAIGIIVGAITLYNTVAAIKNAMAAVETASVWGLVAAYAAQAVAMMAALAPYVLIVALIAVVVAAIAALIIYWDEIASACSNAWNSMASSVSNAASSIQSKTSEMASGIVSKINEIAPGAIPKFIEIKNGAVNAFNSMRSTITGIVSNIRSSIASGFSAAKDSALSVFNSLRNGITNVLNAIKTGVKTAVDKIKSFFKFEWELPKIKLPHFSIKGEFSLMPPSIPTFDVDWYARGGVFDKPTLFGYSGGLGGLGEAGAEAIVPLENNTKWLDKIAERLAGAAGSAPIVLQVDGKTFAETSITTLNQLSRQRGGLPLVIV